MLKNKIKSVLALFGFSLADFSRKLGIAPQSLQTKMNKDAYKIKDLIELGELTNLTLAYVDKEGKIVMSFERDDLMNQKKDTLD